ncbi:MAG: hypothetical protein WCY30_06770, partial [Candidatus Neomarinimicrobiota bacterium]
MQNQNHLRFLSNVVRMKPHHRINISTLLVMGLWPFILSAQSAPLASGKSKFLGGATSSNISSYLAKYFNQVTPGNDGK